eukprot:1500274-Pleurochrysis_carterae.AAC.1
MQSPQLSIVTPAPSPAPIDHSPTTDPTTAAQSSSVAQPPTSRNQPPLHPDRRFDAYVLLAYYLILADYSQVSCT